MKLLITGASGFIGNVLITKLKEAHLDFETFKGDLRDETTFNKGDFDLIVHLASLISHKETWNLNEYNQVNVIGTRKLLEHYSKSKMVYVSTKDVMNSSLNNYAKTKLDAEKLVIQKETNLVIRLPSVFGIGTSQKKLIPLLFNKYCKGGKCKINNNEIREYIFVEDVVNGIISNLHKKGLIYLDGIKLANYDLNIIIKEICNNTCISKEDIKLDNFIKRLKIVHKHFIGVE